MTHFLKKLLRSFVKELKNIIIALVAAVIIWFAISIQIFPDIVTHVNDIPVAASPTEYMKSHNLSIADGYQQSVSVQISGKRYDIGNLGAEDFTATLDLSEVNGPGEYKVGVTVEPVNDVNCKIDDTNLLVNVEIKEIISRTFSIADGTMTVTADKLIPNGDNLKINSITVEPDTVTLTGNSTDINAIKSVEIRSDFEGRTDESISSGGKAVYIGDNGAIVENPNITADSTDFRVNVSLHTQKTLPLTVQFTNVPEYFDLSSLKYSIYPEELTISSPDASIDLQETFEVGVIDLSTLTTRYLQQMMLPITLPEGYNNVSGNTSARITFEGADDYTFLTYTVPKENVIVTNAPDNYDVTVLTNELSVNVTGPSTDIAALTARNIYVTVDLMGTTLSPGLIDMNAEVEVRRINTKCWVTGEYTVSLQVSEKPEEELPEPAQQ
ncbi:MAG: hypothetical protein J1E39_07605 [Eubacterium sp.]|nr:hypothetical protein [Eubacterium sp.]